MPDAYKHYIKHTYGKHEFVRLEARCIRRSNAELREVAALAKPSSAQAKWFKGRMDSGEKSGPELNGDLDRKNWLRRFITNEPTYLWQFPEAYRKDPTDYDNWWKRPCRQMYLEEMVVSAQWLCMNNTCKANLGQLVSFFTQTGTRFANVVILRFTVMVSQTTDRNKVPRRGIMN